MVWKSNSTCNQKSHRKSPIREAQLKGNSENDILERCRDVSQIDQSGVMMSDDGTVALWPRVFVCVCCHIYMKFTLLMFIFTSVLA